MEVLITTLITATIMNEVLKKFTSDLLLTVKIK